MQDSELQPTETLEAAAERIDQLLESARRRIWVLVRCNVLNSLPEIALGKHFARVARRTRHSDLRMLVDDDLVLKKTQPRLAHTLSRLSSTIAVRCYAPEVDAPGTLLLAVDRSSWLHMVQHKGQLGVRWEENDPPGTQSIAGQIEEEWAVSTEALELRRLSI